MQIDTLAAWLFELLPLLIAFAIAYTVYSVVQQTRNKHKTKNTDPETESDTNPLMAAGFMVVVLIIFAFALAMVLNMGNYYDLLR